MVIRRIRQHVAAHNWFSVAIDLAIVVAGVFLGTQANNWNQARLDRALAQSYRSRLIEDLHSTERAAQTSIAYYTQVRGHAIAALRALDRPNDERGLAFLVDAYQATQIWPRSYKHLTYDEILASGHAELMGAPATRERVANFYWRMDGLMSLAGATPAYRSHMRSIMPYSVQAIIRARCDEIVTDIGSGLVAPRLPEDCPIALPPAEIAAAVAQIALVPELRQELTGTMIDLDSKLLNFGKVALAARELRADLADSARR